MQNPSHLLGQRITKALEFEISYFNVISLIENPTIIIQLKLIVKTKSEGF